MTRLLHRSTYHALILLLLPAAAAAQVPVGDSAWAAGDLTLAKRAYERALADDSTSVRSLYRLSILQAWDGRNDSALVLLRRALRIEPDEPDVRLQEATVLAWAGRNTESQRAYEALLRDQPNNPAVLTGRGQLAAWNGDHLTAVQHYLKALRNDSTYVPAWVGLAEVRRWQGRPAEANSAINRALALAPEDRSARAGRAAIRAATRPELTAQLGWSNDSDENTLWWQTLGISSLLRPGLRGFASVGLAEASDPIRDGTRLSAEAGATVEAGNVSLTGAIGGRRLAADGFDSRSVATWRASASYRLSPRAGVGVGYSHYSFDETALLLGSDFNIDELSLDGDVQLTDRLSLGVGAGTAWISDDNQRWSAVAALTQRVNSRISLGLFGRAMGYDEPGAGYFAPDRFLLGELRGAYTYSTRRYEGRLSGGFGAQQIDDGGETQSEWHAEARIARRWAVINELALSGGVSNSAAASTTGAFRYYTAALTLRLGL